MGNILHKIANPLGLDPGDNYLWDNYGKTQTGAAPPAYNPANNPGAELHTAPASGPPQAPPGSTNGYVAPPSAAKTDQIYSPNYWEQGGQPVNPKLIQQMVLANKLRGDNYGQ